MNAKNANLREKEEDKTVDQYDLGIEMSEQSANTPSSGEGETITVPSISFFCC